MWGRKKPEVPAADDDDLKADYASMAAWEGRVYDIAIAGLERAKTAASTVQGASAAIAALYTGALGLVFSVTSSTFPIRGLLSPLFLGIAVVLSTAYLAFLTPATKDRVVPPGGQVTASVNAWTRVNDIGERVDKITQRRAWAMRAAVIALGVGLVCMPAPFLSTASFEKTPEPPVPAQPSWPAYPTVDSTERGSVDFGKILYQAQVNEFQAHLDDKAAPHKGFVESIWFVVVVLFVGILLIVLLPIPFRRDDDTFQDAQDELKKLNPPGSSPA